MGSTAAPAPLSDPFTQVPRELADRLRPLSGEIIDEVVREIQHSIPEYARPADDTYMRTLRAGVEQALKLFMDRIADPESDWEKIATTYHEIGRGEAMEGRSLDALQAALRLGARVAWRHMGAHAEELALLPTQLTALGEAAFVNIHQIAEAATAGYTEARLRQSGELQRRRKRLVDLLLADPPASPEAIRDLAQSARWPVPRRLAVVALAPPRDGHGGAERLLVPPEVLVDLGGQPARMVVPDPEGAGRARALAVALRGRRAAIGPTVEFTEAARSLRWATEALVLMRRGILPGTSTVRCTDHLSTLLLFGDEALLRTLSRRLLAPLAQVRAPQRDRLAETLLAWLQSGSSAGDVAARLHVHPQTVRYRLRQLEQLFGDRLRDPDTRFDLELVLRAESLRRAADTPARSPQT
ncbi:PucR family transcriptional regulator [Streptomyces capparidis]